MELARNIHGIALIPGKFGNNLDGAKVGGNPKKGFQYMRIDFRYMRI